MDGKVLMIFIQLSPVRWFLADALNLPPAPADGSNFGNVFHKHLADGVQLNEKVVFFWCYDAKSTLESYQNNNPAEVSC